MQPLPDSKKATPKERGKKAKEKERKKKRALLPLLLPNLRMVSPAKPPALVAPLPLEGQVRATQTLSRLKPIPPVNVTAKATTNKMFPARPGPAKRRCAA